MDTDKLLEYAMYILGIFVVAILLFVVVDTFDNVFATQFHATGIVIGLEYEPSTTSVGVGVSSDGKPVTVVSGKSETHVIVVKVDNHIDDIDVETREYYAYSLGDTISLVCSFGSVFNDFQCVLENK